MWDLKTEPMNVIQSLIQELMFYEFKLSNKTAETTKNICSANAEGAVDHSTEISLGLKEPRWSDKIR